MSSDVAIRVEGLGKRYRIGAAQAPYKTIRESLSDIATAPFRRLRNTQHSALNTQHSNTFWALKDVSFEIQRGEVVGIIGRNGAGKSTLLKILSRITEPTEGCAEIHGRVGSLLEVGTGFHPELTGRDNIYLNGAILGMRKTEIDRKFDEIVAFAEVEKFIDTPVKHYSSGMYVRLAFAVAAHLEPEIMLVDEVLAVGDAAFQKKCMGKMGSEAKAGRTVFFVSHNMRAIRQLCQRAIWLDRGEVVADGGSDEVVSQYLRQATLAEGSMDLESSIQCLPQDPAFRLKKVTITQDGQPSDHIGNGQPLEITIEYDVSTRTAGLRVFFDLCDQEETMLIRSFHDEDGDGTPMMEPGHYVSRAVIPADFLSPIQYDLRVLATVYNQRMCIPYPGLRISLNVEATGRTNRAYLGEPYRAKLAPLIPWVTTKVHENDTACRNEWGDIRLGEGQS